MLKSCQYCGKIHDRKFICPKKPKFEKKFTQKDTFRSSSKWQKKRSEIRDRDMNLCQLCIRNDNVYVSDVQIHHIVSLENDYNKRLDNDNLICLCSYHHELAERGDISIEELLKIAGEQEDKYIPPAF